MLKYLDSNDNVIVCRISGRLDAEELRDITQKVLAEIDRNEKTHMYCEIAGLSGIDWKAWTEQLPSGLPLLGKLERFGRIAVVSDQPWIRWATRIESALLPKVSYEVFDLSERDRALEWVEGGINDPHGSDLRLIPTNKINVFAFELTGRVCAEKMQEVVREITSRMDAVEGKIRMLGRFRNFRVPEPRAVFDSDYFRMKLSALRRVERYAVVGGPAWFRDWISLVAPLLRIDIRYFSTDEEPAAWQWLDASPAGAPKHALQQAPQATRD